MRGTIKSTDELSTLFKTAQKYTSTNLIALLGKRRLNHCTPSSGQFAPALPVRTSPLPRVVAPSAQTDLWQIDSESDAQAFIGASLGKPDVRTCLRGRLAFVAGKRLGSAPERNRAKRLMREAAHQLKAPWDDRDVVFVARDKTVTATLDAVVRDMECLLRRMNSKKG